MRASFSRSLVALTCLAAASAAEPLAPAVRLWQEGQDALLKDRPDEAIDRYTRSLALDPTLARNFLSLAAAHLHKGADAQAVPWLARYVAVEPGHAAARSHYAELLTRLDRLDAAEVQWHRFVGDVQRGDPKPVAHLLQAHTRLMEIAARRDDPHGEHLHRGVGLYYLAWMKAERNDPADDSPESLLCQATVHLTRARQARPDSARACWYLHRVWAKLGQGAAAQKWLAEAAKAAALPGHDLTATEAHDLALARARP